MRYAILPCGGMDKAEGSLSREVGVLLGEKTSAEIVCPVRLNRTPAHYKRLLAEDPLIVIDGCGTRCASKLAAAVDAKAERKISISDELRARGASIEASLRLDPAGLAVAEAIVDDLIVALNAPTSHAEAAAAAGWEAPRDFLIVAHDKYEFRIPKEEYFINENDVWARPSGARARVGISDYMQQRLTELNYFDPPKIGAVIEQFGELGTVESTKAAYEVVSPVSGTVVAVNQEVIDAPELANEDPYGRGWLVEVELADWQEDQDLLLDAVKYAESVERKAAED
jgi:glycine cleavage system H protein